MPRAGCLRRHQCGSRSLTSFAHNWKNPQQFVGVFEGNARSHPHRATTPAHTHPNEASSTQTSTDGGRSSGQEQGKFGPDQYGRRMPPEASVASWSKWKLRCKCGFLEQRLPSGHVQPALPRVSPGWKPASQRAAPQLSGKLEASAAAILRQASGKPEANPVANLWQTSA